MAVDLRQDFTYFHHVRSILKMNKLDKKLYFWPHIDAHNCVLPEAVSM